jgi:hypothetical protein
VTTLTCPKGHLSETDDFCDTCGARMTTGTTATLPAALIPAPAAPPPPAPPCPNCGAPRTGALRFCEDCGFDHSTGKVPVLSTAPVPAPAVGSWSATIATDRAYFEDNAVEGAEFPDSPSSRTMTLPVPQVRIGRKSNSKGTHPEIDLADEDPGVSHSHALLTLSVDNVWLLSDLGSTNGTYLNDEEHPLTAGETRPLKDGDRVHVGAWTTITLHAP